MQEFLAMKKLYTPAWGHTAWSWQAKRTEFQFTVQTVIYKLRNFNRKRKN